MLGSISWINANISFAVSNLSSKINISDLRRRILMLAGCCLFPIYNPCTCANDNADDQRQYEFVANISEI